MIPKDSICAIELRCEKCRTIVGAVYHVDGGLRAVVLGWTSIPTHAAIGDAMSNAESYSTPGTRGDRWGLHGRRADATYFDPPDSYAAGACGRCECYHELASLDWTAVRQAIETSVSDVKV